MPEQSQPTVSKAFAEKPRVASDFYERYTQSAAGQSAGAASSGAPSMESQHVEQGSSHRAQPSVLDHPYQVPQYAPVYQQPPVQAPQYESEDRVLARQLAQERNALVQTVQQQQQQLAELMEKERSASLEDQLMQSEEMRELETVDPEDARRLVKASAKAMSSRVNQLENELARQRQLTEQSIQYIQRKEQDAEKRQWAKDVVSVHPDFMDLYNDPAFLEYLRGRDGYNRFTRDELATAEFNAGNTAYVIDMIDRFKRGRPNVGHVASVAPVQTAGAAYANTSQKAAPVNYTLSDLNSLMQTRQISQDEYRKRLDALRGAWRAANS